MLRGLWRVGVPPPAPCGAGPLKPDGRVGHGQPECPLASLPGWSCWRLNHRDLSGGRPSQQIQTQDSQALGIWGKWDNLQHKSPTQYLHRPSICCFPEVETGLCVLSSDPAQSRDWVLPGTVVSPWPPPWVGWGKPAEVNVTRPWETPVHPGPS